MDWVSIAPLVVAFIALIGWVFARNRCEDAEQALEIERTSADYWRKSSTSWAESSQEKATAITLLKVRCAKSDATIARLEQELLDSLADDDRLRSVQEQLSKALEENERLKKPSKSTSLEISESSKRMFKYLDELEKGPIGEDYRAGWPIVRSIMQQEVADTFAKRHDEIGVPVVKTGESITLNAYCESVPVEASGIYTCPSMPGISFSGSGGCGSDPLGP